MTLRASTHSGAPTSRTSWNFPKRYEGTRIFRLETNYRSTPEILDLANNSISHNRHQFEKNLRAVRTNGITPVLSPLRDVIQQAEFVAQRILELRDEGVPLNEIAVLYRAHYHCMELQMELTRRDIPFEVRSGLRFFEQAHIKDVVAFLRVMVNPTDEISWKRILKMFPRIGNKTADHIYDYIKTSQDPVSLFTTKKIGEHFKTIQKENLETLSALFEELEDLQAFEAPADMISAVLKHGYTEYAKYTYANHESRLEDISQLINFSTEYHSLVTFLSELSLMSGITGEEVATGGEEDEKVILSTIHQAKGLEWRAVFMIWCAEGRFPNPKAVEEGETEEERTTLLCRCHAGHGRAVPLLSLASVRETGGPCHHETLPLHRRAGAVLLRGMADRRRVFVKPPGTIVPRS